MNIPFNINVILLFAFCVRVLAVIMMNVFDVGPQQWTDESSFYNYALDYLAVHSGSASQHQINVIELISKSREFTISYFLSFLMSFFSESIIFCRMISVFFGVGAIFLIYRLTYMITNSSFLAKLSAIISALFPALIVYSSMITREPFIVFFILLGLFMLFLHKENNNPRYIILYIGCIFIENYMHGGVAIALALVGFMYFGLSYKEQFIKILPKFLIMLLILIAADFTYLNNMQDFNLDFLFQEMGKRASGNFAYSSDVNSLFSFIVSLPSLIFNFLIGFSFKLSLTSLVIMVNSLIWLALLVVIYLFLPKLLVYSSKVRLLSLTAFFCVIIFSIGSANYGTALRHKSKFAPLLIILATSSIAITNKKYFLNIRNF